MHPENSPQGRGAGLTPRRRPGRTAACVHHPTRCFWAFHLYVLPRPVLRLSCHPPDGRSPPRVSSGWRRLCFASACGQLAAGARPGGPRASSSLCGPRGPRSGVPAGADASTPREMRWICGDPGAAGRVRTQGPPCLALCVCPAGRRAFRGFTCRSSQAGERLTRGPQGGTPIPQPLLALRTTRSAAPRPLQGLKTQAPAPTAFART